MQRSSFQYAGLAASLLLLGCHGENAPEPPVDSGLMRLPDGGLVEPAVELGYYYEASYDPFEAGDACPIFYALQGGSWTMPAVRIRGIASPGHVVASFITADDEQLGQLDQRQSFFSQNQGWIEIKRLPIPARHAPPNEDAPIEDLFGQNATLTMTISDEEGHSATAIAQVVLTDDPIL